MLHWTRYSDGWILEASLGSIDIACDLSCVFGIRGESLVGVAADTSVLAQWSSNMSRLDKGGPPMVGRETDARFSVRRICVPDDEIAVVAAGYEAPIVAIADVSVSAQ